jgi:hypothetical protein
MTARRVLRAAALALIIVAGSCDSGPPNGPLDATLTTSATNVGAVAFSVTAAGGYAIDTVEAACTGCDAYLARIDERHVRAIVTGDIVSGAVVARVLVSDAEAPEAYAAQVREMAGRDYAVLIVAGSEIALTRVTR